MAAVSETFALNHTASKTIPSRPAYLALAALIMAYGWAYRGTVGHEAGAMAPGALLGLAVCLGSGRVDWHRRSVVAGLFAAVGWAWGGSLSYMEQTFYSVSDSRVDVFYAYAMLFMLGGLWAGIGSGVLGLALTEPRSELERLVRAFSVVCAAFLVVYVYFFFNPGQKDASETFTIREFHDGDWLPAAITLGVSALYWLARPKDRPAAALFFWGAVAWWVGYLSLTKFGGLRLGPLQRSESWGGVIGILVALIVYLVRRQNRAALMLSMYGILGGGMAFAAAVFVRHPLVTHWGPFSGNWPQWRAAEASFGLFMGLAIALGAWRLLRGGLAPPVEDTPRTRLDVIAAFVVLIALVWINFRRHVRDLLRAAHDAGRDHVLGAPLWMWFVAGGALASLPVVYALHRYARGDRALLPATAFGKAALVALMLAWVTVVGYTFHDVPAASNIDGHLILWVPAAAASLLLMSMASSAGTPAPANAALSASDPRWNVGRRYWILCAALPVFLLCLTELSLAMQDGPLKGMGRKRFGPDAYWRRVERLFGEWNAVGKTAGASAEIIRTADLPVTRITFDENRGVAVTLASGEVEDTHRWYISNPNVWVRWYGRVENHPGAGESLVQFRDDGLIVAWPSNAQDVSFVYFELDE